MKKKILFALIVLSLSASAQAQIIVQSTRSTTKRTSLLTYRGYVDVDGMLSSKERKGVCVTTAHGIQINPRFWVGIGIGFANIDEGNLTFFNEAWVGKIYDSYGHDQDIRNLVPEHISYIIENRSPFINFAETKINILRNPVNSCMPYVSAAIGWSEGFEGAACYSHLKIGTTWYNRSRSLGFSGFIGMATLNNVYYAYVSGHYEYLYNSYYERWGVSYFDVSEYDVRQVLYFNVGLAFEFGGTKAFSPQAKRL